MLTIDLSTVEYDGHAVVAMRGELDVTDAAGVASALADIVDRCPNSVVDLTALGFIDCGGLRALTGATGTSQAGRG
jgi:anti-anti-sigma factor